MGLFALHNDFDTTSSFAGGYSVLNLRSNINIKNSVISNFIPSLVINNGMTNIISTSIIGSLTSNETRPNIVVENSKHYIDDIEYNDNNYTYVECGSLFNYSNVSPSITASLFDSTCDVKLLIIPSNNQYYNRKDRYIEENFLENIGTGLSGYYSTHFLNNGKYGYWGNKYAGLWTNDKIIAISTYQALNTFINTIPRNLNGYLITVNYYSNNLANLNITNFYNGVMNFNLLSTFYLTGSRVVNIENNNLTLNINFSENANNFNFYLNDNKDVNITFNKDVKNFVFEGSNNYLNLKYKTVISSGILDLFKYNSYGNKVFIDNEVNSETSATVNLYFARRLEDNNLSCGNYIVVNSVKQKIANLVNDTSKLDLDDNYNMTFTIDEVFPKKYRDVADIGTIIGWNAKLPIPRGYYRCNSGIVPVDLLNPNDEFYNGQLAWYLNGTLTGRIQLPYLPNAKPTCLTSDPFYYKDPVLGNNFVPEDPNAEMIYIIKYNNNFENKKGGVSVTPVTPTPSEPLPEPTPTPVLTLTDVSVEFEYYLNSGTEGYTLLTEEENIWYRQKVYKDYGGTFDRVCRLKIPRQAGDTNLGSKYVLSNLTMKSEAHGHWVDPAAVTETSIQLNGAIIDMRNNKIYNSTISKHKYGVPSEEESEVITYTETNAISINPLNSFIDIKIEQNDGECYRWSHTKAHVEANESYIYIVLQVVCHSDRGALENNIWYTDVNQITGTGCKFYKLN